MIIILKPNATQKDADEILDLIQSKGLKPLFMPGVERVVIGAIGDERILGALHLQNHPMVEKVKEILAPYKLVSREMQKDDTIVNVSDMGLVHIQRQLQAVFQKDPAFLADHLGMCLGALDDNDEVSSAGGSHPRALAEPDMTLSRHPAPIVRPRP